MTGGTGRDRFFLIGTDTGNDRIMDFSSDDMLVFRNTGFASVDAVHAMAHEDAAGNLVFDDGQDMVTLVGLHASDLSWITISI